MPCAPGGLRRPRAALCAASHRAGFVRRGVDGKRGSLSRRHGRSSRTLAGTSRSTKPRAPVRKMARFRSCVPENPVRPGRSAFLPRHPDSVRSHDLHQSAEVASEPAVRAGRLFGLRELRGGAGDGSVLVRARTDVLLQHGCGRVRALRRLHSGDAREPLHALQETLYDDIPCADDDRADRGGLQLLDDLHRQRPAQSAARAVPGARRHRTSDPLAFPSSRGAVGDHHRRRLAMDLAHLPHFPLRLFRVARSARQRGAGHGARRPGRSSGKSSSPCSDRRSSLRW